MRRLLLLLPLLFLPLLLVGCDVVELLSPDPAIPSEFAGTHTLVSIGGVSLPAVADRFVHDGRQIEITVVEGSIVLNLDGTLRETRVEQHYVDGVEGIRETIARNGTWVTDQEQIDVTWEGRTTDDTTYLYDNDARELWLDMDDPAAVWRYRKND